MRHASVKDYEKSLSGGEPSWNNGQASLSSALNWYNYHSDSKESKKFTLSYLKEIGTPKKDIELVEKNPESDFENLGFVCRMKLRGAPLVEKNEEWITSFISKLKSISSIFMSLLFIFAIIYKLKYYKTPLKYLQIPCIQTFLIVFVAYTLFDYAL